MIKKPAKKKGTRRLRLAVISIHASIRGMRQGMTARFVAVLVLTLFQCSTELSKVDNRTFILDVKGPG
mgnify:CR=1 FL=1